MRRIKARCFSLLAPSHPLPLHSKHESLPSELVTVGKRRVLALFRRRLMLLQTAYVDVAYVDGRVGMYHHAYLFVREALYASSKPQFLRLRFIGFIICTKTRKNKFLYFIVVVCTLIE